MLRSWEGNCWSGVALAMRHADFAAYSPTSSNEYEREISTRPTVLYGRLPFIHVK